nr:hypothetical protein StreXyl84_36830 [Streptomyces sp. Xyl84]
MRNHSWVCGKNSWKRSSALPSPGASEKSIIRVRACTVPVERAYPPAVGTPSVICTVRAPLIRQGASAGTRDRAEAPAPGAVTPAVRCAAPAVLTARVSAVTEAKAAVRRVSRGRVRMGQAGMSRVRARRVRMRRVRMR